MFWLRLIRLTSDSTIRTYFFILTLLWELGQFYCTERNLGHRLIYACICSHLAVFLCLGADWSITLINRYSCAVLSSKAILLVPRLPLVAISTFYVSLILYFYSPIFLYRLYIFAFPAKNLFGSLFVCQNF